MVACVSSVCACCGVVVMFALRPLAVSCAPLQMESLMLRTCTPVQQGRGRRSAWHAGILQLHQLGAWLCSLGVLQQVRCCAGRGGEGGWSVDGCVRVECLRLLRCCGYVGPATACCLTRSTAGLFVSNVVDWYNASVATTAPSTTAAPSSTTAPATTAAPPLSFQHQHPHPPPLMIPSPPPPYPPPPPFPLQR